MSDPLEDISYLLTYMNISALVFLDSFSIVQRSGSGQTFRQVIIRARGIIPLPDV